MKKYFILLVAFLCILFFSGFQSTGDWQLYTSKEGGFSIEFPGLPEEQTQNDTTDAGVPFLIHFASVAPSDNEVYMAGWIDMNSFYPEDASIQQMLENSRDGATNSMHATHVTTLATVTTGNPYIEFTFETNDLIGKDRIYLIHKFQYSIITIFSKETGIKPGADRFIASFKNIATD